MKKNKNSFFLNMYLMDIFKLPSSISWCESKYQVVPYIAEFWNTLTGICLIASGLWFYKNNQSWMLIYSKYYINFSRIIALLVFVGIGTMLFHSTLYYPFQLLDELPMILLSNEYLVLLMSLQTTREILSKHLDRLNIVLSYSYTSIPFVIVSYFIHPTLQIISFHITLKISEICIVLILYRLSNSLNHIVYSEIYKHQEILRQYRNHNKKTLLTRSKFLGFANLRKTDTLSMSVSSINRSYSQSGLLDIVQTNIKQYIKYRGELKNTIQLGLYFYGISIGIWCVENMFCKYVQPFQLHAVWHLLSSIGIYHLNTIMKIHIIIDEFTYKNYF